jgi:glutamine---fructose-6-phosphate transaminase (isomerizing)
MVLLQAGRELMCGIVGILGREPVADKIIASLRRLEYRGYDSAGLATLESGRLTLRRAQGKLKQLEDRLSCEPLNGTIGIGHTRWATHGRPSEINAHPHATDVVAVVHNGIIENFRELRRELEADGVEFRTQTDTEVVAHLVTREMRTGREPVEAVEAVLPKLRGTFGLAFLFDGETNLLVAARQGSPLAVGYGDGEMYLASDAAAFGMFSHSVSYLDDGDIASVHRNGVQFRGGGHRVVKRRVVELTGATVAIDKGGHRHFMLKEIHEQPEVVGRTLARYLDKRGERVGLPRELPFDFDRVERVSICACGTAYYAGLIAKYWFERLARLPVDADLASEFRYREAPLRPGDVAIFVSQSGETADTLASLHHAREQGQHILSIVNVETSTIARASGVIMPTLAGPEIGVASTKAFTCQLSVLACLAIAAGRARGVLSDAQEEQFVRALNDVPLLIKKALMLEPQVARLARDLAKARDVLYLGRGTSYPLALEGALKLKEISYIHAEGYAAGELKHGPIALIDESMPVVVIAPHDAVLEKTVSNMQEVSARGGKIILIADPHCVKSAGVEPLVPLCLPEMPTFVTPLVYAIPVQLIAYHTASALGTDVDQPRNLAKSVTVE